MSTEISFFQVDAFTRGDAPAAAPFSGNPAGICPLDAWLPDALMQAIAMENNLSETAFFVHEGSGFRLRWFTPTREVDLCGHATLASASVIFSELDPRRIQVQFETRSGTLGVRRAHASEALPVGALVMDFPARPPVALPEIPAGLVAALGARPSATLAARDLVAVFDDAETVRGLRPDAAALAELPAYAVCVTAPGNGPDADVDFVSRFFAPRQGIAEDPVTGSAHCTLAPYWAERLGRRQLRARQVGPRSGELTCTFADDRVELAGTTRLVIRGRLLLP